MLLYTNFFQCRTFAWLIEIANYHVDGVHGDMFFGEFIGSSRRVTQSGTQICITMRLCECETPRKTLRYPVKNPVIPCGKDTSESPRFAIFIRDRRDVCNRPDGGIGRPKKQELSEHHFVFSITSIPS